ncbi:acyl-CoA thioesterase [Streptomyces sp. NPDC001406]|uniref:acyl-CoA thioesterase n=1 Tax=Streptomyces sp. NPDC001406 TaxID=3364572 RepID=UPI0036B91412
MPVPGNAAKRHTIAVNGSDVWRTEFPLRFGDFDGLGHLTASAYLALFEETRSAWMTGTLDVAYPTYVVATQHIEYLHEVTPDDGPVTVELALREVRTSSFRVVEHLTTADSLCARSTATLVMWDMERRRPRPITPDERTVFEAYLAEPTHPMAP